MNLTRNPKAVAIGAAILIALIAATGSSKGIATGISRLYLIGMATGLGFGLGWFLSPQASAVRRVIAYAVGALLLFIAFAGPKAMGWSVAIMLAVVGFCMGFGYWLGKGARGFFAKPTTFGSAEWATEDYLREHDIIGETGIRLGVFPGKDFWPTRSLCRTARATPSGPRRQRRSCRA